MEVLITQLFTTECQLPFKSLISLLTLYFYVDCIVVSNIIVLAKPHFNTQNFVSLCVQTSKPYASCKINFSFYVIIRFVIS